MEAALSRGKKARAGSSSLWVIIGDCGLNNAPCHRGWNVETPLFGEITMQNNPTSIERKKAGAREGQGGRGSSHTWLCFPSFVYHIFEISTTGELRSAKPCKKFEK